MRVGSFQVCRKKSTEPTPSAHKEWTCLFNRRRALRTEFAFSLCASRPFPSPFSSLYTTKRARRGEREEWGRLRKPSPKSVIAYCFVLLIWHKAHSLFFSSSSSSFFSLSVPRPCMQQPIDFFLFPTAAAAARVLYEYTEVVDGRHGSCKRSRQYQ